MNVGDYVRTKKGEIGKIVDIKIEDDFLLRKRYGDRIYFDNKRLCLTEDIIKSSPNIIDLIEVGDYVNGREVRDVYDLGFGKCFYFKNEYGRHYDKTYKIKSIVTHEQFSQMEYKIGE